MNLYMHLTTNDLDTLAETLSIGNHYMDIDVVGFLSTVVSNVLSSLMDLSWSKMS